MVGLVVFAAHNAEAGFWSKLFPTITADLNATTSKLALNSQNIPLLNAVLASDPAKAALGGGDTTIVGGTALLPDAGPLGTTADIGTGQVGGEISLYVVRAGDTLSEISTMFKVSSNTIRWANDIKAGGTIHEGQVLVILPITGLSHTVVKGETLASIVKKYKGDRDEIIQYNELDSDKPLAVGQTIIIPNGEEFVAADPAGSPKPTAKIHGAGGPSYAGYYIRPIDGGKRSQGLHGFNGVDLAAPLGAPIHAAADGTVIVVRTGGWNGGYGNYVVIQHPNGTQTLYAHNTTNLVTVGQRVSQGQTIATIGQTGKATGVHVHFEIRGAKNPF